MKKFYPDLYLLFVWLYITGRICMLSTYTLGQESVRDIKNRILPQNILVESASTIQNEKTIPSVIRKKKSQKINYGILAFQDHFTFQSTGYFQKPYSGHYIDPPPC